MSFNFAQTFYVDKGAVQGATEVGITAVELYFKGKPKRVNNKSGIEEPGVTVFIAPTKEGVPVISEMSIIRPQEPTEHGARFAVKQPTARAEWGEVKVSVDATIPTVFKFGAPVQVVTGQLWAVVIKFDGDEDFMLWDAVQDDPLTGTSTIFTGTQAEFKGKFFEYVSSTETDHNPAAAGMGYSKVDIDPLTIDDAGTLQIDQRTQTQEVEAAQDYLTNAWKPYNDTDLTFAIWVAKYADNGFPVSANATYTETSSEPPTIPPEKISNNVLRVTAPSYSYEFFSFDRVGSNTQNIKFGEKYWQDTPAYPGGTDTPLTISVSNGSVNVTANGSYLYANGTTFNNANGFNELYSLSADGEHIIIDCGTEVHIRQVTAILSNTVLVVDENLPVTNTVAKIYKSPVGRLWHKSRSYTFGLWDELGMLSFTSVTNADCRFVNDSIKVITVTANGQGYSNSDYIVISGYEDVTGKIEGGYDATANIVTNVSGNVTAIYVANQGCGFVNTAWLTGTNVVVANSQGDPVPSGTANGLTMTYDVGCTLKGEISAGNNYFTNCTFINLAASRIKPEITVNNPVGTGYVIHWGTRYYEATDGTTQSGKVVYANDSDPSQIVKIFKDHPVSDETLAIVPSRSNEFVTHYANGDLVDATPYGNNEFLSDACYYQFDVSSNNDFTQVFFQPEIINSHISKYIINNDYTNEHTNYGNAYAKHLVTKVAFQEDRLAEDIVVYLTAFRPVGRDYKVYARIHNGTDPEAFDDKDWTLLDQTDAVGVYSSLADDTDLIEYTYSFPQWPNAEFTQTNTVTTILNEANVNTTTPDTFDASIVANDVVRIYSPLFPNNYVIDVVESVTNSSQIIMRNDIANDNVVDSGMKIEKVEFPKQAFKYISNNNVVRYYNDDKALFTRYDTFQIKVILLSEEERIVPEMDDIRSIGVTANIDTLNTRPDLEFNDFNKQGISVWNKVDSCISGGIQNEIDIT